MKKNATSLNGYISGFTFIELMLGISVSVLLFVVFLRFLGTSYPLSRTLFSQVQTNETARIQLARMTDNLRRTQTSATGSYGIEQALPQKIVFYTDMDTDGIPEKIRYELSGTDLIQGVSRASGNPSAYGDEVVSTVSQSIRNGEGSLFTYYAADGVTEVDNAARGTIKQIQISLIIDENPEKDPPSFELGSRAVLRNLNQDF